ncbi:MAG: hypothetical protein AAF439_12555 [Pseudomonadota bacterium]
MRMSFGRLCWFIDILRGKSEVCGCDMQVVSVCTVRHSARMQMDQGIDWKFPWLIMQAVIGTMLLTVCVLFNLTAGLPMCGAFGDSVSGD